MQNFLTVFLIIILSICFVLLGYNIEKEVVVLADNNICIEQKSDNNIISITNKKCDTNSLLIYGDTIKIVRIKNDN